MNPLVYTVLVFIVQFNHDLPGHLDAAAAQHADHAQAGAAQREGGPSAAPDHRVALFQQFGKQLTGIIYYSGKPIIVNDNRV